MVRVVVLTAKALALGRAVGYVAAMKPTVVLPKIEVLCDDIVQRVKQLSVDEMAVLHRVMLQMEKERLWKEFSEDMAEDWNAGKFARLNEVLQEARAALCERR